MRATTQQQDVEKSNSSADKRGGAEERGEGAYYPVYLPMDQDFKAVLCI
jgi:hypothetical protein